jgi:glucosamine kinase
MALFLGIDGGGTGCRAAVADAAGVILGRGDGGPANITSNPDAAWRNILSAAEQALTAAGMAGRDQATIRVGMGLAGAGVPASVARLTAMLPYSHMAVQTDGWTAAKGALGARDGIVAALGTGSVFAVQRAGVIRQIGGWGLILGDEAGGAWLGRAALAATLRGVDAGHITALGQTLLDRCGGPDGIVVFARDATAADFAALAPQILVADDPLSAAVLGMARRHVTAAITLLQGGQRLPVVFLGGVGAYWAGVLAGPDLDIIAPLGTALDGALILARMTGAHVAHPGGSA